MSKKSPIQWTENQKQVAELLQQGLRNADVSLKLGVAKSLVSKVSKALKNGFKPPDFTYVVKDHIIQNTIVKNKQDNIPSSISMDAAQADTSLLTLKPISVECALTPIMINARYIAITELGFPRDVTWEDFLDTCLVNLFRYWGYGIQGVYKLDIKTP